MMKCTGLYSKTLTVCVCVYIKQFLFKSYNLRPAVINNGMWDQIRVDHGKEFFLTLFMQEILADHRMNTATPPYRQTTSTKVGVVLWFKFELLKTHNLIKLKRIQTCFTITCI